MLSLGSRNDAYASENSQFTSGFLAIVDGLLHGDAKQVWEDLKLQVSKLFTEIQKNWDEAQSIVKTWLNDILHSWQLLLKNSSLSKLFLEFFELVNHMGSIQVIGTVSIVIILHD